MLQSSINMPEFFSIITGKTNMVDDATSINNNIKLLFLSGRGELFGDPDFGSDLLKYVYEPNNTILEDHLKSMITNDISYYETRIRVTEDDIQMTEEDEKIYIRIGYKIKATNQASSTVIGLDLLKNPRES